MSKIKLTPWFPGDVKPVRPGVYQQLSGNRDEFGYQRWDGRRWCLWCRKADDAARSRLVAASGFQNDPWRGLAEKPS